MPILKKMMMVILMTISAVDDNNNENNNSKHPLISPSKHNLIWREQMTFQLKHLKRLFPSQTECLFFFLFFQNWEVSVQSFHVYSYHCYQTF